MAVLLVILPWCNPSRVKQKDECNTASFTWFVIMGKTGSIKWPLCSWRNEQRLYLISDWWVCRHHTLPLHPHSVKEVPSQYFFSDLPVSQSLPTNVTHLSDLVHDLKLVFYVFNYNYSVGLMAMEMRRRMHMIKMYEILKELTLIF